MMRPPTRQQRALIDRLLGVYDSQRELIRVFMQAVETSLTESAALRTLTHSVRSRLKDREHLRDKLLRKLTDTGAQTGQRDITPENLLQKVNDLAGVRILHLHTTQISRIDPLLRAIFDEQRFTLVEGPIARTWDDEYRSYFKTLGISTQASPSLYTSVHYVIGSASKTTITCELQVRTLMEEVWGEVDHILNYPHNTPSVGCREQLKALARVTSSATRLVDSVFATWEDFSTAIQPPVKKSQARAGRRETRRKSRIK